MWEFCYGKTVNVCKVSTLLVPFSEMGEFCFGKTVNAQGHKDVRSIINILRALKFKYRIFVIKTRALLRTVSLIILEYSEIYIFLNKTRFTHRISYGKNMPYFLLF